MNFVTFLREYRGIDAQLEDRYGNWLGYEIGEVSVDNGAVVTHLTIRDDHLSPSGAVHGGVVSGFLDFSCGAAVFSVLPQGHLCSTVELQVKYFKPLKSGDRIQAQAEVVHQGKKLCSVIARVVSDDSEDEQPVAMATATFNVYPLRRSNQKEA